MQPILKSALGVEVVIDFGCIQQYVFSMKKRINKILYRIIFCTSRVYTENNIGYTSTDKNRLPGLNIDIVIYFCKKTIGYYFI